MSIPAGTGSRSFSPAMKYPAGKTKEGLAAECSRWRMKIRKEYPIDFCFDKAVKSAHIL
jgi:hypothetical protein